MFRKLSLVPALMALGLACPAAAQTAEPAPAATPAPAGTPVSSSEAPVQIRMSVHVNGHVLEDLRTVITDDKTLGPLLLRMVLISKQEAVGASCPDYSVDRKRMVSVMLGTIAPATEGLDPDRTQTTMNQILRHYHTMLGGALAQYAYDPDGFCAAGKDLYDRLVEDADGDKVLVLMPAS